MPYNTVTGNFTPVTGAETATAGQTIASATWNAINTDYQTAFTQIGPDNLPYVNGAQNARFFTNVQTINFAASASDIATFAISSILPPSVSTYQVNGLRIGNAKGNLNSATVSLFTAAGGAGTVVITSTATTVTTSVAGNSGSLQTITGPSSIMWNSAVLFLHVTSSTPTSNQANVSLEIIPVY